MLLRNLDGDFHRPPALIQFDLGEEAPLEELVFNACGGGGAGVVEIGVRVFVSLDDKTYIPAAEHVAPPAEAAGNDRTGVQIRLPLNGTRARYVALASKAPPPFYFVFVDEIEIHGRISADPASSLPVQAAVPGRGAEGLQATLSGGTRAANLMRDMTALELPRSGRGDPLYPRWTGPFASASGCDAITARRGCTVSDSPPHF